jgi:hypothetical protein
MVKTKTNSLTQIKCMITKLKKNEIFVFGSNLNGAHAGGAALLAFQKFGAVMGVGDGITGSSYAFPTLDKKMQKVSISAFKKSVKKLYETCKENPSKVFLLTKVGCGIAGFAEREVQELFKSPPTNLVLPEDWREIVAKEVPVKILYKFLKEGMKSAHGDTTWKIGKWKKETNIRICNSGFHASDNPYQAFSYIQGEILSIVEARGESNVVDDKSCWEEMRVIKAYRWQKKDSVQFSIFAAELVLENYQKLYPNDTRVKDAIEAAKAWVKEPTDANASAAASAYSAASAASAASAYSAYSAAASAAYSAASAARSAAASAVYKKFADWMLNHIKNLEEMK